MGACTEQLSQCNILAEKFAATIVQDAFVTPVKSQVVPLLADGRDDDANKKIATLYRDSFNKLMAGHSEFGVAHPECQATWNTFAHATETLLNLKYRALYAADTSLIPIDPGSTPPEILRIAATPIGGGTLFGATGVYINGSIAAGATVFSAWAPILLGCTIFAANAAQPNIDSFDAPPKNWDEAMVDRPF